MKRKELNYNEQMERIVKDICVFTKMASEQKTVVNTKIYLKAAKLSMDDMVTLKEKMVGENK
ncbi:hypothetical protein HMPREF0872_04045 [Veillonella montpellierensis DNF00314]|uniref:Uncharacterized protein n=1 Tax=Veillonella montpellierensis DNF00314 TaxID=1401067 RepID=A0A096AKE0_9FIRM|nr:hypothetical protein [Veillonella montpellierensis]KGF47573.1 hypothetical protein HMPREF0872_04045 [Veillonella montpellierensis DNF00314]